MKLEGRTALVTGGATRIGRAICDALAGRGCGLVVHYHSSARAAANLVAKWRSRGVVACAVRGDLSEEESCGRVMAEAWASAGRIDMLVNNAAVFRRETLAELSICNIEEVLRTNLLAPVLLTREFARLARRGRIVNLLDARIAGHRLGSAAYTLSKKALAAFTADAALELAPRIIVNGVAPGPVLAPKYRSGVRTGEMAGIIPLAHRPSPAEVAAAVVFLLESDSITGQIVFVDGGQHLLGTHV